jgi:hypothetical protein
VTLNDLREFAADPTNMGLAVLRKEYWSRRRKKCPSGEVQVGSDAQEPQGARAGKEADDTSTDHASSAAAAQDSAGAPSSATDGESGGPEHAAGRVTTAYPPWIVGPPDFKQRLDRWQEQLHACSAAEPVLHQGHAGGGGRQTAAVPGPAASRQRQSRGPPPGPRPGQEAWSGMVPWNYGVVLESFPAGILGIGSRARPHGKAWAPDRQVPWRSILSLARRGVIILFVDPRNTTEVRVGADASGRRKMVACSDADSRFPEQLSCALPPPTPTSLVCRCAAVALLPSSSEI